jgi:hypothetical protein
VKLTKQKKKENIEKEREVEGKKKQERVPRKTAGRDGGQSKKKPDSQTFKAGQTNKQK